METAGTHRIEYTQNNETEYHVGLSKRKIKQRMSEHKGGVTAIALNRSTCKL